MSDKLFSLSCCAKYDREFPPFSNIRLCLGSHDKLKFVGHFHPGKV